MSDRPQTTSPNPQPRDVRIVEDRWATIRHAVEAIAIVAAGLWAAYVFIYQERIKPALEPPSLQPTVTFDPGKTVSGTRVAQLHVELVNTGHVDTDVYAETVSVFGDRFVAAAPATRTSSEPSNAEVNRMAPTSRRELIFSSATLHDAAIGGAQHLVLTPDQHYTVTVPIAVKDGRFDELNADIAIVYGRFRPDRHHFARIAIAHDKAGALYLKLPAKRTDDDGLGVDFSAQTTL